MRLNKWQWALVSIGGAVGAVSTLIPPTLVFTVPAIGVVGAAAGLKALSGLLIGWAVRTPGHAPTPPKGLLLK